MKNAVTLAGGCLNFLRLTQWNENIFRISERYGDSVFATNLSRTKFGDAELKHRHDPRIVAVEAHGGRLTRRYVEDHLFTMRAVLAARREELEDRAAIADWVVDLVFVAHQVDADVPASEIVSGELRVEITYRTFADLGALGADPAFVDILNDGPRSPDERRACAQDLSAESHPAVTVTGSRKQIASLQGRSPA